MELHSRFLGTKLDKSMVVKKIWLAKPDALPSSVKRAKVFRLARGNGVMLLELEGAAHWRSEQSKMSDPLYRFSGGGWNDFDHRRAACKCLH